MSSGVYIRRKRDVLLAALLAHQDADFGVGARANIGLILFLPRREAVGQRAEPEEEPRRGGIPIGKAECRLPLVAARPREALRASDRAVKWLCDVGSADGSGR